LYTRYYLIQGARLLAACTDDVLALQLPSETLAMRLAEPTAIAHRRTVRNY